MSAIARRECRDLPSERAVNGAAPGLQELVRDRPEPRAQGVSTRSTLFSMRIVVSGTHASGKSTLISDFVHACPEFEALDDPFELVDELDAVGVASFVSQFRVASTRLLEFSSGDSVIAERGPLDFLAYLIALGELGRLDTSELVRSGAATAALAMTHVDLLAVLPVDTSAVGEEEDPELREAMAEALLNLIDDAELTGGARVCELVGSPSSRLAELVRLCDA